MSAHITEADKRRYLDSLRVTDDDIRQADACKQRTDEWFAWRSGAPGLLQPDGTRRYVLQRMTGSIYGAAAKHKKGSSEAKLLRDMLWPTFKGNDATEYGSQMEATALRVVEAAATREYQARGFAHVWIEETGIRICKERPWLAASSDGLLFATDRQFVPPDDPDPEARVIRGTVEIKCPWAKKFYERTPHDYYDQFQGAAALHHVNVILFGVYTPNSTQVNHFTYQPDYWTRQLLPALERFYMTAYLPRAILKDRGLLRPGEIDVPLSLPRRALSAARPTTPATPADDATDTTKRACA